MVDSKENGKFDLGVEGLKCPGVYITQQGKDNCSSFFHLWDILSLSHAHLPVMQSRYLGTWILIIIRQGSQVVRGQIHEKSPLFF